MNKNKVSISSSFPSFYKYPVNDQTDSIIGVIYPVKKSSNHVEKISEVEKAVNLLWEDYNAVVSTPKKRRGDDLKRMLKRSEEIEEDFEKRVLRSTIDGLNERLLEQRIKVAELRKENEICKRERIELRNNLEAYMAEVNYLNKISVPSGDPYVVRKIVGLEKMNRELIAKYQKLLSSIRRKTRRIKKKKQKKRKKKTKILKNFEKNCFPKLNKPPADTIFDCKRRVSITDVNPQSKVSGIRETIQLLLLPGSNYSPFSVNDLPKTVDVQTDISAENWLKMCKYLLSLFSMLKTSRLSSKFEILVEIEPKYYVYDLRKELTRRKEFFGKILVSNFHRNITQVDHFRLSSLIFFYPSPRMKVLIFSNVEQLEGLAKNENKKLVQSYGSVRINLAELILIIPVISMNGKTCSLREENISCIKKLEEKEMGFLENSGFSLKVKNYLTKSSCLGKPTWLSLPVITWDRWTQTFVGFSSHEMNLENNYEDGNVEFEILGSSNDKDCTNRYSSLKKIVRFHPEVKFHNFACKDTACSKTMMISKSCVKLTEFIQGANRYIRTKDLSIKNARSYKNNLIYLKFDYSCNSINYGIFYQDG